jgi:hypothetical protein
MRIAFNTTFQLIAYPGTVQGQKDRCVMVQGQKLYIERSFERGVVNMLNGQSFSVRLVPNPFGHKAAWLALEHAPDGLTIGAAAGSLMDWGYDVVVTDDEGQIISH